MATKKKQQQQQKIKGQTIIYKTLHRSINTNPH